MNRGPGDLPRVEPYDVFLCYNHGDKPTVRQLYNALSSRGLRVWFDEVEMAPGVVWLPALEQAIRTTRAAAIVVGAGGLIRWAEAERQLLEEESIGRGIPIVPVLLPGAPQTAELPGFLRRHHRVDLSGGLDPAAIERLVSALRRPPDAAPGEAPLRPLFRAHDVPPLQPEYQDRPEREPLKRKLLARDERPVSVIGLHGMAGVGKTVLAAALANDPEVLRAFPHGVFWFTLGREVSAERLKGLQAQWIEELTGAAFAPVDLEQGKDRLRALLRDRACLLVLDDVWNAEHAEALAVLGRMGKLLLTTRNEKVGRRLGAEPDPLGELAREEGLSLLARYAGVARDALPSEAREVARECGDLPLALAMAGSMVRSRPPDRWRNILERLRRADLGAIEALFPGTPHTTLLRAIEVSVHALPEAEAQRYIELAVFPEDTPVPEAALAAYFAPAGVTSFEVQDLVDTFTNAALARRDGEGRIVLHDLQHDYVRRRAGDLVPLHRRLIEGYRLVAGDHWHAGRDDGYFFDHLAHHLAAAGRDPELRALLLNPRWLAAKLRVGRVQGLLNDFTAPGAVADVPLRLLRDALRLSSNALAEWPQQLGAQLTGRLGGFEDPELARLLAGLESPRPALRPLWPSLAAPGGPLVRVLRTGEHTVSALALTPDGRRAISANSYSSTVLVWDLGREVLSWSLAGHEDDVRAVAMTADGRWGVSAARDGAVCVWDLEQGRLARRLPRQGGQVRTIAVTPDGRLAACGGNDRQLNLWDLRSGEPVAALECEGGIERLSFSADGALLLCCMANGRATVYAVEATGLRAGGTFEATLAWLAPAGDRILAVTQEIRGAWSYGWEVRELDPSSGAVRRVQTKPTWSREKWPRFGLALTGPGYFALTTGSSDRVVEVWDPAAARVVATLEGHEGRVRSIEITPDGRAAITGGEDADLILWDLGAPRPSRVDPRHEDGVDAIVVVGEQGRAFSLSKDSLREWDLASGRLLSTRGTMIAWSEAALTGSGRFAATIRHDDDYVTVWDLATASEAETLHGHSSPVGCLAMTPDGRWVVSGSFDREDPGVRLYDRHTRAPVRVFEGQRDFLHCVAITPDARRIASGDDAGTVNVFTADAVKPYRSFRSSDSAAVSAVALTPDGRWVASASLDGLVDLWEVESGSHRGFRESREPRATRQLAVTPEARNLFVSCFRVLTAWDPCGGRTAVFVGDAGFTCLAATPAGNVVAGDTVGRVHHLAFEL